MNTAQYNRFNWLSEQILFNKASDSEQEEFNQLFIVWNSDKEINICKAISNS